MSPEGSATGFLNSARNDCLLDPRRIPGLVFCNECFAKLIECPVFNLSARLVHQI